MSNYIAIDGGTTNTRVMLLRDRELLDSIRLSIGARKSIEGCELLKSEIKRAIQALLVRNGLDENAVTAILASGMITSEFGLCHLGHIPTPAGIRELHDAIQTVHMPEISSIPFSFIRGVRVDAQSFEGLDVMRGEETELMGILDDAYGECAYVLPGSHSKIIRVDAQGRIADFRTMLTGEMIGALREQTILKDAVDLTLSETDTEYLLQGYDSAVKMGINQALFKVRILKSFLGLDKTAVYSFFLGVVLSAEIEQILRMDVKTVVLGGKAQIKNAMADILKRRDTKRIVLLDEHTVTLSTAIGALRIFEGQSR